MDKEMVINRICELFGQWLFSWNNICFALLFAVLYILFVGQDNYAKRIVVFFERKR